MNTATDNRSTVEVGASEEAAIPGRACWFDILISEGERWIEDGVNVIRSTEFDVVAGDPDFDKALAQFFGKLEDLWVYLSGVEELSDNENETFLALAPRFLEVYKELERREEERRKRLVSITFGGLRRLQRGTPLRAWHPSSQPLSSSPPSVA
jgi:hypothetical protein